MTETNENYFPERSTKIPSDNPELKSQKKHQLIIPYGLLFVLILYLTTSTIKWAQSKSPTSTKYFEELNHVKNDLPQEKKHLEILNEEPVIFKLLEHPEKCYDLQIFTRQINTFGIKNALKKINQMENNFKKDKSILKAVRRADGTRYLRNTVIKKHNISNELIRKSLNNKNKYNAKHIKSIRNKNFRRKNIDRKDILRKNPSTAEPIIYLFALVFIYLLLKAASDINQHYKSQTKGDKRMRRYSLQSYAQVHKPDRRASKTFSSKNVLKL